MFSLPSGIVHTYLLLAALRQVSSSPQPSRPSPSVTSTIFATPISSSPIPTSSASPLCYAQNQDPGLGFLSQFCICGTLNFPLSTPTPSPIYFRADDYCSYTTLPCLDCTSMGAPRPLGTCTTIPNCNTKVGQTSHTATAAVTSEPVGIGSSGKHYPNNTISLTAPHTHSYIYTQTRLPLSGGRYWELIGCTSTTTTQYAGYPATHCVDITPISTQYWGTGKATATTAQPNCKHKSSNGTNNSTCGVADSYCSLRGPSHSLDGLEDQCILWDKSCCGEKTSAASRFWTTRGLLEDNSCFYRPSPECSTSNPPGRMSIFSDVKSWMRQPECLKLHHEMFPDPNHEAQFQEDLFFNVTCCGYCKVIAEKVDVYYWPTPDADTSCQSIVGDEVSSVADGATTNADGDVYWGCTYSIPEGDRDNFSDSLRLLTTASLTTIASLKFKAYAFNPWDPSPCMNTTSSVSPQFNRTTAVPHNAVTLRPRAHSLLAGGNISTAVLGTYTFTSPSIYVGFKGLDGGDNCGSTSIPATTVAFDPGELSTIVGPVAVRFSSSKVFNPADLPCPPQSVMSENWYTPLPGVPYRPYFAFPDKIRRVIPDFAYCNAFYFNAFDPPRTLKPVDALDPPTTTVHPTPTSQAPRPSSVQDPGPTKTPSQINSWRPLLPQPGHPTHASDPKQTDAGGVPGAGGNPDAGGNAGTGRDPSSGGNPSSDGDPGTGGNLGAGGDPGSSNGHGDQPTAAVLGGGVIIVTPTTKDSNTQQPANLGQNRPQSDPSSGSVHADPGQGGGSPGIPGQVNGISGSDSQGSTSQGSDPSGGDSQGGNSQGGNGQGGNAEGSIIQGSTPQSSNPQGGNSQGSAAQNSDPQGSNGQDSVNSGSTGSSGPGSGSSSSGSAGSDSHGSSPGSNPQLPEGEVGSPTTIQLGQVSNTGPTTIHLGNQGGNQQTAEGAAVISPGLDAPLFHPGQSGQLTDAGSNEGSNAQPPVVTVASQVLTVSNPSAVPIAGAVLTPGGQGVNIGGTPVTLGPSGNLVIGSNAPHAGSPSVLTIAGNIITANPTSFSIAGTVVQAGQPAVTVSGVAVSLGSSGNLVIGGNTGPTPPLTITRDGIAATFAPNSQAAVDGSVLSVGGPGVIVSGKHTFESVSVGASGLVIGSNTIAIPTPASPGIATFVLTTDGVAVTIAPDSQVAVDGSTLSVGGPGLTVSGKPVSVGSAGLIIGTNTIAIPTPASPLYGGASVVVTTDGQVITFLPSGRVAVGGQTLSNGGQAATLHGGVAASVGTAGLVVGGSDTIPLPAITPVAKQSVLTTDGETITFLPSGQIAVDGQTLNIGEQATKASGGLLMSVGSSGLVIGSDTISIPTFPAARSLPSVLTTDGEIITLEPSGLVAIGGATLSAGGSAATITASGTVETVSVGTDGLVIGSNTIPLPSSSALTSSKVDVFTGGSGKATAIKLWALLGVLMVTVMLN